MLDRRTLGQTLGGALLADAAARIAHAAPSPVPNGPDADPTLRFAAIEARIGGRLGIAMLDTRSDRLIGHRMQERFPMASTYKALAAASVLAQVDRGQLRLDQRIAFGADQVIPYSPRTKAYTGEGLSLAALCEAAVELSDNTAANLLLAAVGGPGGVTAFARGIGDTTTRLDRTEPTLNEALPDDPRDTTTPAAMAATLNRVVLGDALSASSRQLLASWLVAGRTGDNRLRAGLPQGWRIGDKTGTGDRGTANDIGVVWPPGRPPVVLCVFITGSPAKAEALNAAIADVARTVAPMLQA